MLRQRADILLVARGLFESRAKAQEAIAAGLVSIDGQILRKGSAMVAETATIAAAKAYPWVSRGGVKLAPALDFFGFDPKDRICLDIGASTGGFTDVLLNRGAAQVYAVDVGHGQLHPRLTADPRVIPLEATDARSLRPAEFATPPSLITCDVSFISLRLVLPAIWPLAARDAALIVLVKPRFEVGRAYVMKGIVKDEAARLRACAEIEALLRDAYWQIEGTIDSPIEGADGNREYLIGAVNCSR